MQNNKLSEVKGKELVAAGHAFAKAIGMDTPLIEIAKMVSELAGRLDCALVRGDELAKQRDALAAENALIHSTPSLAAMMSALDAFYEHEDLPETGMLKAHTILLPKRLPATHAALNAIRAEGVIMFASKQLVSAGDLESTITIERLMLNAEELVGQLRGSAGKDDE